jgi:hypothetical protein
MENLVSITRCRAQNTHHEHPELVQPIFASFRTTPDAECLMRDAVVSSNTHITPLYSERE